MNKEDIENINIIKRQTNYKEEEILEKLKKHKNDIESIILEYNDFDKNTQNENITTNQKYSSIRDNMNEVSLNKIQRNSKVFCYFFDL